ncbi:MAG: DUF6044 family protein, partial [Bacillales bacterium]|nr:DUF6044 family protein [Bacillales bacterium]
MLCLIIIVFFLEIGPYLFFFEDCVITIHDNLDNFIDFKKLIYEGSFFWNFSEKSRVLGGLVSAYFCSSFTLNNFLYFLFKPFTAYSLEYIISLVIGFSSMFLLLENLRLFRLELPSWLCLGISLIYSILPVIPEWRIGVSSMPIGFVLLINVINRQKWYDLLFCFLFPFISHINCVGIFLIIIWSIIIAVYSVKHKKFLCYPSVSLMLLVIGYLFFNMQLFYMRFILSEDLNRMHLTIPPNDLFKGIYDYAVRGWYHVATRQKYILCLIFFLLLILLYKNLTYLKERILHKGKLTLTPWGITRSFKFALIFGGLIFINCLLASLYDSHFVKIYVWDFFPFLKGFSLARFYVINKVFWCLLLSVILVWVIKLPSFKYNRVVVFFIICLQTLYVLIPRYEYNDSIISWKANLFSIKDDTTISFKEFYDVELFNSIKKDINYKDEIVAAVGYHPAVLIYNNFSTVDGYWSYYPYKDMLAFRKIIAPELKKYQDEADYYDSWGGRRYLYCKELSYLPTRNKVSDDTQIELRIDSDVFAKEFNGKYILSRAKIKNADKLGMNFIKYFS